MYDLLFPMTLRIVGLIICVAMAGCGPNPRRESFSSEWSRTIENGFTNDVQKESVSVICDGNQYRITDRGAERERTEYFDGQWVSVRYRYFPIFDNPSFDESVATGPVDKAAGGVSPLDRFRLSSRRAFARCFWIQPTPGKGREGMIVAGRMTRLYQRRTKRPEGENLVQWWVDPQTGITLRLVDTQYSEPTAMLVRRTTLQCDRWQPGPVNFALLNS